ncbi:MAG: co-chaperone GroES [Planctomycetota bacterium]|jgi:chaperonin GroES
MKIRPLADKVLVERLEAKNKTAGGIVLPDSAKEKPQKGRIISVGKGKTTEVKIDGKEYLIMEESGIMAVIEK